MSLVHVFDGPFNFELLASFFDCLSPFSPLKAFLAFGLKAVLAFGAFDGVADIIVGRSLGSELRVELGDSEGEQNGMVLNDGTPDGAELIEGINEGKKLGKVLGTWEG